MIRRPNSPVLIVNPKSGDGSARHYDLVRHCRLRGIEPVVLEPGREIASVAAAAVDGGAEVIGAAGGDGTQAAVATVAFEHDVPYVCVPAGTRNHFALDLGVDCDDVVGALDAFLEATERRVDLARVNGRVFVNNASLGLYGEIVRSPDYRDAKLRTILEMLPELIGPGAEPFDLRYRNGVGVACAGVDVIVVSNNPYDLDPRRSPQTRGNMDGGVLGVVAVPGGPLFRGWSQWTVPTFEVDSDAEVNVGLDGEAVSLEPPLQFESLSSALRVRCRLHPRRRRRRSLSGALRLRH